jgi:hypothetical protein
MSVRLEGNVVVLEGQCRAEDAEPLLGWLQTEKQSVVDMSRAEHLHAAVLQVLIVTKPDLRDGCQDPFVAQWVIPLLREAGHADTVPQGSWTVVIPGAWPKRGG